MKFPTMFQVRQTFDDETVEDIPRRIKTAVREMGSLSRVTSGRTVAVACSSRGIAQYATIVESTVDVLKAAGLKPFIVPAMGSHGGGTAEGQRKVLADAGITEETMGVPIHSSLETVPLGATEDDIPVFMDRWARSADYIVPVNRIKAHTMFNGEIESGLMKMLAVGLGKQKGPALYHQAAFRLGLERVIRTVARTVMAAANVLFGVGVVENSYGRPARIGVFSRECLEKREMAYLKLAKRLESRIPLSKMDVLIVDEMGKDISGAGLDCNVIGRIDMPLLTEDPPLPDIKRIVVCDLTEKSEGNAVGIGLADFTTRRLVDKIDLEAMYVNALTASDPEHAKIPMTLKTDREAVHAAMSTIGRIRSEALRMVRIRNTKQLEDMWVSEACLPDVQASPSVTLASEAFSLSFNAARTA